MMDIVIIGAGVIGLTTAVRLQEHGYSVRIISKDLPENTTSAMAAAIWFPYMDQEPEDSIRRWGLDTYEVLKRLVEVDEAGVSLVDLLLLWKKDKDVEWRDSVPERAVRSARPEELPAGYDVGYFATVPLAEAPIYLRWLRSRFEDANGQFEQRELDGLEDLVASGTRVVNCTGLGARELVADLSLTPIRGQVVTVKRRKDDEPAWVDYLEEGKLAHMFPRSRDLVLGGTGTKSEERNKDDDETRGILERCRAIEPELQSAELLDVKVGLRPYRKVVRCERDPATGIIHNYGHGGTGYTLSWGCADEVLRIIQTSS